MALGPDGRIVAAGEALARPIVAAYRPDGRPDATFGTDGIADAKAAELGPALGVAVDGDGRIVTVGRARGVENDAAGIARLTPDGAPDETFNREGRVILDGLGDEVLHDVALDPAGGIVAVGEREARNGDAQILLVRLTAGGTPDRTFGADGELVADIVPGAEVACRIAVQADGSAVLAGAAAGSNGDPRLLVGRVLGDLLAAGRRAGAPSGATARGRSGSGAGGGAGTRSRAAPLAAAGVPTGGPAADRTGPVLRRLRLAGTARLAVRRGPRARGRARRPQVRFTADEAGAVVVSVQRRAARGRHVRIGAVRRVQMRAGADRIALPRHALRAGRYRVGVVATDRAGNRAPARYVTLRVRAGR